MTFIIHAIMVTLQPISFVRLLSLSRLLLTVSVRSETRETIIIGDGHIVVPVSHAPSGLRPTSFSRPYSPLE